MAQKPSRRRHQYYFPALALLEHLPPGSARDQPGLRHVGVHDVEKILRILVDDLRHLVLSGRDHEDIDAAECLDRRIDNRLAIRLRARPLGHRRGFAAELFAGGRDFLQFGGIVGAEHDVGAGAGEHLRRQRAERAGGTGGDRGLAADVEQGERIFQKVFGHDTLAATTVSLPSLPGIARRKTRVNALMTRQSIIFARRWMRGSTGSPPTLSAGCPVPRMTEYARWP